MYKASHPTKSPINAIRDCRGTSHWIALSGTRAFLQRGACGVGRVTVDCIVVMVGLAGKERRVAYLLFIALATDSLARVPMASTYDLALVFLRLRFSRLTRFFLHFALILTSGLQCSC